MFRLKKYQAMDVIKDLVDEKYYRYYNTNQDISENIPGPDISDLMKHTSISDCQSKKDLELSLPLVINTTSESSSVVCSTSEGTSVATNNSGVSTEIVSV